MATSGVLSTQSSDSSSEQWWWREDALRLFADAAAGAAGAATKSSKSAACGFCRGACIAARHDVVSCERCPRSFHRRCVQPSARRRRRSGSDDDNDNDSEPSSDEDALMTDDTFVCGFCVPLKVSTSARCALCHQPPRTTDGELAPLVGPFYASASSGASSASQGVYVHPHCGWWSNHFPWHELATAPSCLRCASCGGPNASVRCTGCIRKGGDGGIAGRLCNCRQRYHYACAAEAGLIRAGAHHPHDFICPNAHYSPPSNRHSNTNEASASASASDELVMSPSGRKRRRAGEKEVEALEKERETLRASVVEKERLYAKVYAERAELVERLDLMADRAQEAQERAARLDRELEQLRHDATECQSAAAACEERLRDKLAARKTALAEAQAEVAALRDQISTGTHDEGADNERLKELEAELAVLREEKEEAELALADAKQNEEELRERAERAEDELEERDCRIEELTLVRDELQDRVEEATEKAQRQADEHRREVDVLRRQMEDEVADLRAQLEAMKESHDVSVRRHREAEQAWNAERQVLEQDKEDLRLALHHVRESSLEHSAGDAVASPQPQTSAALEVPQVVDHDDDGGDGEEEPSALNGDEVESNRVLEDETEQQPAEDIEESVSDLQPIQVVEQAPEVKPQARDDDDVEVLEVFKAEWEAIRRARREEKRRVEALLCRMERHATLLHPSPSILSGDDAADDAEEASSAAHSVSNEDHVEAEETATPAEIEEEAPDVEAAEADDETEVQEAAEEVEATLDVDEDVDVDDDDDDDAHQSQSEDVAVSETAGDASLSDDQADQDEDDQQAQDETKEEEEQEEEVIESQEEAMIEETVAEVEEADLPSDDEREDVSESAADEIVDTPAAADDHNDDEDEVEEDEVVESQEDDLDLQSSTESAPQAVATLESESHEEGASDDQADAVECQAAEGDDAAQEQSCVEETEEEVAEEPAVSVISEEEPHEETTPAAEEEEVATKDSDEVLIDHIEPQQEQEQEQEQEEQEQPQVEAVVEEPTSSNEPETTEDAAEETPQPECEDSNAAVDPVIVEPQQQEQEQEQQPQQVQQQEEVVEVTQEPMPTKEEACATAKSGPDGVQAPAAAEGAKRGRKGRGGKKRNSKQRGPAGKGKARN